MSASSRTWALRAGAVGFGLLLVVGAEAALRASGQWSDPPAPASVEGWDQGARLVQAQDRPQLDPAELAGQRAVRTSRSLVQQRFMHDVSWTLEPPEQQLRVFAFGGSTTYGVPVEAQPERTFPGRMSSWLERLGSPAEVINLGGASFGSDQVLTLAKAVSAHGADAMVVYSANNEFFQYALALYGANQAYPTTSRSFQRLHLFRALEGLLGGPPVTVAMDEAVDHQRQVVARVVEESLADPEARPTADEDGRYRRRDVHYRQVIGRYAQNLAELEQVAATAGTRLLIVDVPPNLQQSPWLSLHDPDLTVLGRRDVAAQLVTSTAAREGGDALGAAAAARDAVDRDPMYAAAWHALGMALLDQGELTQAELALRNALELDMDPGRPVAALGEAVATVTSDGASELVDLSPLLAAEGAGPFGGALFHDSCHLTAQAYDQLGRHLAMAIKLGEG